MRRRNAIRLAFVGMAIVTFDFIVGERVASLLAAPYPETHQSWAYWLIADYWLRLFGAFIALLGGYFWITSPRPS
jgi:hypothetical protein